VSLITVIGISMVAFVLIKMTPGDPVLVMLGVQATPENVAFLNAKLGLDQPASVQYLLFLKRIVFDQDFGVSAYTAQPVLPLALSRLANTVILTTVSILLGTLLGIVTGVVSVRRRGGIVEQLVRYGSYLGFSIPVFVTGLLLIYIFSVNLRIFPFGGLEGPAYLVLPVVTLTIYLFGMIGRIVRASLLDVLGSEHVIVAKAKGLTDDVVFTRHVFRNTLVPVVTYVFYQFGTLLGGAMITEVVFAYPGIGRLIVESVFSRDFPIVQATILIVGIAIVAINLTVDLSYGLLDPRMRIGETEGL
jgi:peptide/nickel transport system permease protein